MSKIDWSAASVKELMENGTVKDVVGKAAEKIKAEAAKPVTLNFGHVSDDSRSMDNYLAYTEGYNKAMDKYRNAIIRELIRLRGISPLTDSVEDPTTDPLLARIDELLIILVDVEDGI